MNRRNKQQIENFMLNPENSGFRVKIKKNLRSAVFVSESLRKQRELDILSVLFYGKETGASLHESADRKFCKVFSAERTSFDLLIMDFL
jgi:hypothetical protein